MHRLEGQIAVMRTRTSFQKRQKEIARAEKQRDKIAKRQQKKLMAKPPEGSGSGPEESPDGVPDEGNDAPDSDVEPAGAS